MTSTFITTTTTSSPPTAPGTRVKLLGLPSPPATNSDTSAGSTRVRQKEVESMSRRAESAPPPDDGGEMEEHTPRAEGREWLDEKAAPVLERTLSLKSRSEDVLERMKSLRLSRSTAPTPAPDDEEESPPPSAHSLLRMRSATFGSYEDDEPPPVFSRRTTATRPRLDMSMSMTSSISGSETEREAASLHRRMSSTASHTSGSVAGPEEDDQTIHARHSRAFTAPRRHAADAGPRSASVIGMSGSGGSRGSGSGGGTTRAKLSPKVRKGLPVEFRRSGEEQSSPAAPAPPETTTSPPTMSRNSSSYASTSSTLRRRERESSITSDASFRSPSRAGERAAARRSMTSSQAGSSNAADDSPSSRTVLIHEDRPMPSRTTSITAPSVRRARPSVTPLTSTTRKVEEPPLTASALSPRTPGGTRSRTLVGQELRAAGITSRHHLSDPPDPSVAPAYSARSRYETGPTREPYTPLASRFPDRERERERERNAPASVPRAQTSMSGSWRDRERQREREILRTDPMPSRATLRRVEHERSQTAVPYDRPASVADWRAPTPDPSRLEEPEHVRILWEALHTFGSNLGRVEGSDDGTSGLGSGESRTSMRGVGAVVGSARSAVEAIARVGEGVRLGVARGMQRVVQAELDDDALPEDSELWKEELRHWRQAGKEVDEAVRALTGLMLGVGRVLRDAGVVEGSMTSRRSADSSGVRRWSAAADLEGSATERDRRAPLPALQAHDTPPPSSRLNLRKRATLAGPTPPGHAHSQSLEYESQSLSRHTSLRTRQPARPQLPSVPSEGAIPRGGSIRMERKASTASTASNSTLRGTPSGSSPTAAQAPTTPMTPSGSGSNRSLKDRLTNFPALSHGRPTTSIDTTPASATAPYAFSAASLTPHIASPSLPRRRRGSMRESLQGLFSGAGAGAGGSPQRPNGIHTSRRDSVSSLDDLEPEQEPAHEPELQSDQDRRVRRGGRYFAN